MKTASLLILVMVATTSLVHGFAAGACQDLHPWQAKDQVCPIHKKPMISGTVPGRWGLVSRYDFDTDEEPARADLVEKYFRAKEESFPETRRWINYGCMRFPSQTPTMTIFFCDSCRRVEKDWFSKHPGYREEDKWP